MEGNGTNFAVSFLPLCFVRGTPFNNAKARRVSRRAFDGSFLHFWVKKWRKAVDFCERLCYSDLGAAEKRQAVWPPAHVRGRFLPPDLRKGGCGMTTSEVFQLLLVLIGICDLFIQAYKKK